MDSHNSNSATHQAIHILEYWHKIEFFESTDIKDLEDNADGVLQIEMEDLQSLTILPWINPEQVRRAGHRYSPAKKYRYELFFGIFDRREIFQQAQQYFQTISDIDVEKIGDDGRTCSIKCVVDQNGMIDSDSFEFSTVTWALGQLKKGSLDNLLFENYELSTKKLHDRFKSIITVANNIKQQHHLPNILTTFEIIEFLQAMAEWTPFQPQIQVPALFIKLREVRNQQQSGETIDPRRLPELSQITQQALITESRHDVSAEDRSGDISILNSFYLRDIEQAMTDIRQHGLDAASPLGRYLTGDRHRKADLLLPEGRTLLVNHLRLNKLPAGRWLSDAQHNMSLMQQFAINTLEDELAETGLFSVNGPPGTGKTTLLRDVIANNLVKRARVLANLNQVDDAFSCRIQLRVNNETRMIPCLRDELTGFEMVVVSSNNTAVENISRELPQVKSLGDDWQAVDYLKSSARKLAATARHLKPGEKQEGKTFAIDPLSPEEDCWGLIAVALGKQKNREQFKERAFTQSHKSAFAPAPADEYRNLFSAINGANIKNFAEAKLAFKHAEKHYQDVLRDLQLLETQNDRRNAHQQQRRKREKLNLRLYRLQAIIAKRTLRIPGWWTLRIEKICREKAICAGLHRRLTATQATLNLADEQAKQMLAELEAAQQHCDELQRHYPDVMFADAETDIEAEQVQRSAFGQGAALNAVRSQLMACALDLHQAWLKASYRQCNLKKVLFSLSDAINGGIADRRASLALWQLLFMIVPVVSSTFASVYRQFKHFSAAEIGWLFIDEAGQATPQQAAGALWRAKRAVVVGDPLQIEPVFTIPPAFVETLAERAFGDQWREWSPTTQSVQNLADRVNPYGTAQIAKNNWLGSPLRVHRRCDEPMFSIANAIAYNNKMLHGRDQRWPRDSSIWGASRWLDIGGEVTGKHYVPAQGERVLEMVRSWLDTHGNLPDVYVISPFRQVKNQLKVLLRSELGHVDGIKRWLDERVGTVHTFQGKEEKNVIIVLGLDARTRGAAKWASAKPNLLNVAVTRAQKRVYIIGSKNIWANCPGFQVADEKLGEMAPNNRAAYEMTLLP